MAKCTGQCLLHIMNLQQAVLHHHKDTSCLHMVCAMTSSVAVVDCQGSKLLTWHAPCTGWQCNTNVLNPYSAHFCSICKMRLNRSHWKGQLNCPSGLPCSSGSKLIIRLQNSQQLCNSDSVFISFWPGLKRFLHCFPGSTFKKSKNISSISVPGI